jgi:hypothetical protein
LAGNQYAAVYFYINETSIYMQPEKMTICQMREPQSPKARKILISDLFLAGYKYV